MTVNVSLPASVEIAGSGQQGIRGLPGTNGTNGHTPQVWGGAASPGALETDGDLFFGTTGNVYQQIGSAWVGPIANIKGPKGDPGGGGSTATTRRVRITDDNLGGLPSAPSWTVVVTSGGTHLQCAIPAVANDRVELFPNFMRVGSHFTDFVLLDNTGAISQYASTESGTPGPEGSPAYYPSLSQEYVTSADMFTVASNHIDGSGNITIAYAHQGTGAGIIYAHPFYPWRLRLKNIGPEPA